MRVPGIAAAMLIAAAVGVSAYCEARALDAAAHRDRGPAVMTAQMCQSCHTDAKTLALMKEKQGFANTAPTFLIHGLTAPHGIKIASGGFPIK